MTMILRASIALLVSITATNLLGCNAYVLQGTVVRGVTSGVELVDAADERLDQPGVSQAQVRITRDPSTLNRHLVGQARTNPAGEFTIVMDAFGTGWMKEEWLVQAVANGFQNAESLTNLPSKNSKWRVLITLAPGISQPVPEEDDLMEDLEQFK